MNRVILKIGKKTFEASYKTLQIALMNIEPQPINRHYVEVNGRLYPVEQAINALFRYLGTDEKEITERDFRYIQKLGYKIQGEPKRANELDGTTWLRYSISIWNDIKKTKEEIELKHPAIFPSALARRLIECFTTKEDRVILDPFVGVGSTLIAAKEFGKDSIGIEISPEFASVAKSRISQIIPFKGRSEAIVHIADSRELLKYVNPASVDLVITSPPYWNILLEKRTADYKETRHYGEAEEDLGKINDYKKFLFELRRIFEQVYIALKPEKYCCVVVMDLRKKSNFYPYHMDVALFMQEIGFILDDIIIWDRRHEYNNMRPLGYPTVFRINKAHEFILIFKKP